MPAGQDQIDLLKNSADPYQQRDLALQILANESQRQAIDLALHYLKQETILESLSVVQRPIIREKALYYFSQPATKDKAGMLREQLIRLLVQIGHPDDADIYHQGVRCYYRQPVSDVAQHLRAVSLAGLAYSDPEQALVYAVKFLNDPDNSVFTGEPAVTAVDVLGKAGQYLPLYQYVAGSGISHAQSERGEAVGRAMNLLLTFLPADIYQDLLQQLLPIDSGLVNIGIIEGIIKEQASAYYPILETIITSTRHADLSHYALIMMATSTDRNLKQRLLEMASFCKVELIDSFLEALTLLNMPASENALQSLQQRKKNIPKRKGS